MLGTAGYMVVVVVAPGILLSALGLFRFSIFDSQSHSQSQSQSLDNSQMNRSLSSVQAQCFEKPQGFGIYI